MMLLPVWLRWTISIVAILLMASVTGIARQAVVIGPTDAIGFDYPADYLTTYQVTHFEASYDSAGWASLGVPPVADHNNGILTYRVIPPQATGTHTVVFRVCNAVGCSAPSLPFAFALPGGDLVVPVAPSNVRRIPR